MPHPFRLYGTVQEALADRDTALRGARRITASPSLQFVQYVLQEAALVVESRPLDPARGATPVGERYRRREATRRAVEQLGFPHPCDHAALATGTGWSGWRPWTARCLLCASHRDVVLSSDTRQQCRCLIRDRRAHGMAPLKSWPIGCKLRRRAASGGVEPADSCAPARTPSSAADAVDGRVDSAPGVCGRHGHRVRHSPCVMEQSEGCPVRYRRGLSAERAPQRGGTS